MVNSSNGKRVRVPRLVRVHSDELEDIASAVKGGGRGRRPLLRAGPYRPDPYPRGPHPWGGQPELWRGMCGCVLRARFTWRIDAWAVPPATLQSERAAVSRGNERTPRNPRPQSAGDIVALFGIECASGDTFTDGAAGPGRGGCPDGCPLLSGPTPPAQGSRTLPRNTRRRTPHARKPKPPSSPTANQRRVSPPPRRPLLHKPTNPNQPQPKAPCRWP